MKKRAARSSTIEWNITENSVKERLVDGSLAHTLLPSQRMRRKTKVCNALLHDCGAKTYKQYVELRTGVLRNVAEDSETDVDIGLTDADCNFIYSSPSKQAQYVAENSENYTFTTEDECTRNETGTAEKRKTRTAEKGKTRSTKKKTARKRKTVTSTRAKVRKRKQITVEREATTPEAQSKKPVPSDTEASEISVLGVQDVTNRNTSCLHDNVAYYTDTSNSTEDSFNSTDESANCGDSSIEILEIIDKTLPHNTTCNNKISIDNNMQNCETNYKDNSEIRVESQYQEDIGVDEKFVIGENLSCDQLLSYITRSQCGSSFMEAAGILDNTLLDHQRDSVLEGPQDKSDKIEEFSKSDVRSSSPLNIVHEMLCCPEDLKKIVEEIVLSDLKEVKEDTCYSNTTNQDSKDIQESSKEEEKKNFSELDQVDEDVKEVSINQEETIHSTQKTNSCDIKEQILLFLGQSPVKNKYQKLCENSNSTFDLDKKEIINLSDTEVKNLPDFNQVDRNVDVSSRTQAKVQLVTEESPYKKSSTEDERSEVNSSGGESNDEKKFSTAEGETQNYSKENQNDTESVSTHHKDTTHFVRATDSVTIDLCDVREQESPPSQQSPEKDEQSEVCDVSQDDGRVQELSEQEDTCNLSMRDEDAESDTVNQESEICCAKTEESFDALSPKQGPGKDADSRGNTSEEQDNEDTKVLFEEKNEELMNNLINVGDKTSGVKPEVVCDTPKEQLLPRVVCTEIIDKKYKIIEKKVNDTDKVDTVNGTIGYPIKTNTLINSTNIDDYSVDEGITLETDYEKASEDSVLSRVEKRREQARSLNLVICSDSSESDDRTERDTNFSNSDTTSCSTNVRGITRDKPTKCAETETSRLRVPETCDVPCNSEERANGSFTNNRSSLNKENVCEESDRSKIGPSTGAAETKKSEREENVEMSMNKPRNLQELVKEHKLVAETLQPTFTLADIADEEEAYILNVPTKLLKCNLRNEMLILNEDTIKFGNNTYKIADKQVNTISWVFATGKKRKPYRIANLHNISTITVLDSVSHYSTFDSHGIVAPSKTQDVNKQHREKMGSAVPKFLNRKKRNGKRKNSDLTIERPTIKKSCN